MENKGVGSAEPSKIDKEPAATSVAHQILEEFLSALMAEEGYAEIANRLRVAILKNRPSEAALRGALFGDEPL